MNDCAAGTVANSHSGSGGWRVGRTHVGPQHAAPLDERIRLQLDLLRETRILGFRWHVHALPGHVVLPAMVGTAQPAFFVAAEPQRNAAVSAELVDESQPSVRVAECDQPLRKELYPDGRTVVLRKLLRQQRRQPIAAEQPAHRCSGAGLCQEIVLFLPEHFGEPSESRGRRSSELSCNLELPR